MDSGNSGSMQSSSGGDEEYDSRAESISAFFNSNNNINNPLSHVGPMSNNPPPPSQPDHHHHHHHHHHSSSSSAMFDPLSNYFDPLSSSSSRAPPPSLSNPNSLLNLDMVWSKNLRSDPNCTDLGGFISSSSSPTQQLFTNQTQTRTAFPSVQIPHDSPTSRVSGPPGSVSGSNNDQLNNNTTTTVVRNPKKRSRASRRAPTTVLTTDTTNFRAMVQEFTGIPAPPFTSSPFPRSRLDLFGSTLRSAATHHPLVDPSPPPPYLLRPFPQKIQPPPPLSFVSSSSTSTSSIVDAIASASVTNIDSTTTATTNISSTSINYQPPSDLGLLKQPQNNLLNINPILNFHPLLQPPPPKYPLPTTVSKAQQGASLEIPSISTDHSHLKMGVLEEFGLSHGQHLNTNLSSLQNIVSNEGTEHRHQQQQQQQQQQGLLRSINGNYNNSSTQRVSANGKANFLASSSSDFLGENSKGPENVAARSEGMMESWICSSD